MWKIDPAVLDVLLKNPLVIAALAVLIGFILIATVCVLVLAISAYRESGKAARFSRALKIPKHELKTPASRDIVDLRSVSGPVNLRLSPATNSNGKFANNNPFLRVNGNLECLAVRAFSKEDPKALLNNSSPLASFEKIANKEDFEPERNFAFATAMQS